MSDVLPDCMMPDGGDPCEGLARIVAERDRLRAEVTTWRVRFEGEQSLVESAIQAEHSKMSILLDVNFDRAEAAEARAAGLAEAAARAYGFLWLCPVDMNTADGKRKSFARKELLAVLSHEQKRDGVGHAMKAMAALEAGK